MTLLRVARACAMREVIAQPSIQMATSAVSTVPVLQPSASLFHVPGLCTTRWRARPLVTVQVTRSVSEVTVRLV